MRLPRRVPCPYCATSGVTSLLYKNKPFSVYYCTHCQNGFTSPVPKHLGPYYQHTYWISKGIVGTLRTRIYTFFQLRRARWVKRYAARGAVLDVGAGEAAFAKMFDSDYQVTSIDAPFSKVQNPAVLKQDFLRWKTSKRFDAIVFWQSIEHMPHPEAYLKKAASLLKLGGYLFLEYPRLNSLEAKMFGGRWYHLDLPRHITHFTDNGIRTMMTSRTVRLRMVEQKSVAAHEYAGIGFASSMFGVRSDEMEARLLGSPLFFIAFLPMLIVSCLIEVILVVFHESPMGLTVAQKK